MEHTVFPHQGHVGVQKDERLARALARVTLDSDRCVEQELSLCQRRGAGVQVAVKEVNQVHQGILESG